MPQIDKSILDQSFITDFFSLIPDEDIVDGEIHLNGERIRVNTKNFDILGSNEEEMVVWYNEVAIRLLMKMADTYIDTNREHAIKTFLDLSMRENVDVIVSDTTLTNVAMLGVDVDSSRFIIDRDSSQSKTNWAIISRGSKRMKFYVPYGASRDSENEPWKSQLMFVEDQTEVSDIVYISLRPEFPYNQNPFIDDIGVDHPYVFPISDPIKPLSSNEFLNFHRKMY